MISHYILAAKLFKKKSIIVYFLCKDFTPPPVQLNVFTNVIPNTLHL